MSTATKAKKTRQVSFEAQARKLRNKADEFNSILDRLTGAGVAITLDELALPNIEITEIKIEKVL